MNAYAMKGSKTQGLIEFIGWKLEVKLEQKGISSPISDDVGAD